MGPDEINKTKIVVPVIVVILAAAAYTGLKLQALVKPVTLDELNENFTPRLPVLLQKP